jgi:hypothetical protein
VRELFNDRLIPPIGGTPGEIEWPPPATFDKRLLLLGEPGTVQLLPHPVNHH